MIQTASVIWLSLIGGRLRLAKNSHEPSASCFLTISSAISLRLCFCPFSRMGNDCAATAMNTVPMFTPLALGRAGESAGLLTSFEAIIFSRATQRGLGRIRQEFLIDRIPLPVGFAQCPKRHRRVMTGGALARAQPGGACGLQESNGTFDVPLDLLLGGTPNRYRFV